MIQCLYIDDVLAVCVKPSGVSSESPGLPELLSSQTGQTVYPVHRLDLPVGGVCVAAFFPDTCARLQSLFRQDLVTKEYLAVVSGVPDQRSGTFRDYLFHDRNQNKSYVVRQKRKGVREAVCEWRLVQCVPYGDGCLSLIRVFLHTGRTHQIRVQFASRGLPLVGDRRYGGLKASASPALWSARIAFPHPNGGKTVDASADPPASFPWNCFSDAKFSCG